MTIDPLAARFRYLSVVAALIAVFFVTDYVRTLDLTGVIAKDATGLIIGRDFLNFWFYGQAAWESDPARYYDMVTYQSLTAEVTGPGYPGQLWSYPPSLMLIAAPFGLLPYWIALALWSVIGPIVFASAIRLWSDDRRFLFPLLASPAAFFALISGQLAFVAAALILAVLRWRQDRPVLAGILLGLLTIKPQIGLLFPVLLLATRDWKVIFSAAATALVIAGTTAMIWGPEVWSAYLGPGIANQSLVLSDPDILSGRFMPTVFMNVRLAGGSISYASGVQLVFSIVAVLGVWLTFSRKPPATDLAANTLFMAAAIFGTPYLNAYDTLTFTTMAVFLLIAPERNRLVLMAAYLLTVIQFASTEAGLAIGALVPLGIAAMLWKEQRRANV